MSMTITTIYERHIPGVYGDTWERLCIFTDSVTGIIRYGLCIFGPEDTSKHMTAYLNLPKDEWMLVADELIDKWSITYEGVESQRVSIKQNVNKLIPVNIYGFWIGIDWMGATAKVSWEEASQRLANVCEDLNQTLIKMEIKKSKVKE